MPIKGGPPQKLLDFEAIKKKLLMDKNAPPPSKSEPIPKENDGPVKVIVG
jgi:hypothetical protein